MKLLLMMFLIPAVTVAQLPGRADDSLRKVSDTMHFPVPFEFKMTGSSTLDEKELFIKCYRWINALSDSLKEVTVTKDSLQKKIMAGNIPATADISFSILITVGGSKYSCWLQQYIYHTINGTRIPVDKAAIEKEYKTATNVERVIIMRKYPLIFSSLDAYIKQPN
jgi:hypothetical protein